MDCFSIERVKKHVLHPKRTEDLATSVLFVSNANWRNNLGEVLSSLVFLDLPDKNLQRHSDTVHSSYVTE